MKVWVWRDCATYASKRKPKFVDGIDNEYWTSEEEVLMEGAMGRMFKRIKAEPQQYEVVASLIVGKGKGKK
jgi:hypothetical protein